MSKRIKYPSYGENPARKALCKLKFHELSNNDENTIASNEQLIKAQRRDSQHITDQLVSAMREFYSSRYNEWVSKYWHSALKPNLAASIDSAQRETVYAAFQEALREECSENLRLITDDEACSLSSFKPALRVAVAYKTSSKFLLYARNFEMRTKQKLQIVSVLEKGFKSGLRSDAIIDQIKKKFGSVVLTDAVKSRITAEIKQSLSFHSIASFDEKNKGMNASELYRLQLVYPTLLARALNEFFGSSHVDGLDPLYIVCESLLHTIEINTKLANGDGKLPFQLVALNLWDLEYDNQALRYAAATVVPLVLDWLDRISMWTQFGLRVIKLIRDLSNCSFNVDAATLINTRIQVESDKILELASEALSIYLLYRVLHDGRASVSEPTAQSISPVPVSEAFQEKLALKLYQKVIGNLASEESFGLLNSFSKRLLRLSQALAFSEALLGIKSARSLLNTIRRRLSNGDIYASIYNDTALGILDEDGVRKIIHAFGLAPELTGFESLSSGLNDWEERQYTALIQAVIRILLPKRLGGLQADFSLAEKAYDILVRHTGDLFGALPTLIMQEAATLDINATALVLNSGIWMCTEDPSLTNVRPAAFQGLSDAASGLMIPHKEWVYRWHLGWSAVKCKLGVGDFTSSIQCSALQFEILQNLMAFPHPVGLEQLLPQIRNEEFSKDTVVTFARKSGFLIKSGHVDGSLKFVLASAFGTSNLNSLSPALSDRM